MKVLGLLLIVLFSPLRGESWQVTIAGPEEPGERLVVSGTVSGEDGKTPLEAVSVYVYHTDRTGYYSPGGKDEKNPRLRGRMRTDARGRYEFRTIKPAPYPNNRIPAHIHYVVSAPGYKERVFEIVFAGDPLITDEIRAEARKEESPFSIRPLEADGRGGWRCAQDIRLRK